MREWLLNILFNWFQKKVGKWADETFKSSTPKTIITHLKKEVIELEEEIEYHKKYDEILTYDPEEYYHRKKIMLEAADCAMLLMHLAFKYAQSLILYVFMKFEECKKRKWLPPDEEGVQQHKKI
jgi:hypothetical protein